MEQTERVLPPSTEHVNLGRSPVLKGPTMFETRCWPISETTSDLGGSATIMKIEYIVYELQSAVMSYIQLAIWMHFVVGT